MVVEKHPSYGATAHPEVVAGLITHLRELGACDIEIIESAWIGGDTKKAYKACGYYELSKKFGAALIDLKDDGIRKVKTGGYVFEICEKALETDFLINVPVLKAHCQTNLTCCLKNLKGCISDREKRRFHAMGLHRPIAYLNTAIKTGFCLVDGICGNLTFEEGGTPVVRNMILAGEDPVLTDSYCAGILGYEISDIEYIGLSAELGTGRIYDGSAVIKELNADKKPMFSSADSGIVRRLSAYVSEDRACSACYSALISALYRSGAKPREKINIGQGFKGQKGAFGCGNCTAGHDVYIRGCPPKAVDIVKELLRY